MLLLHPWFEFALAVLSFGGGIWRLTDPKRTNAYGLFGVVVGVLWALAGLLWVALHR